MGSTSKEESAERSVRDKNESGERWEELLGLEAGEAAIRKMLSNERHFI